jgi:hypothetical protein
MSAASPLSVWAVRWASAISPELMVLLSSRKSVL